MKSISHTLQLLRRSCVCQTLVYQFNSTHTGVSGQQHLLCTPCSFGCKVLVINPYLETLHMHDFMSGARLMFGAL